MPFVLNNSVIWKKMRTKLKLVNLTKVMAKMKGINNKKPKIHSVSLIDSSQMKDAEKSGFKTLSEKKSMDSDDLREAINKERPFKELYKNLKWLNHYAYTNIMTIEHALNEF